MQYLLLKCITRCYFIVCLAGILFIAGCNQGGNQEANNQPLNKNTMEGTFQELQTQIKEKHISRQQSDFEFGGTKHIVSYAVDSSQTGKRPGIVVLPEWWGLNTYVKDRAAMLAGLGYAAMAVDMFGEGMIAHNPTEAMALTKPYGSNAALVKDVVEAAITKLKTYPEVDSSKIAVIGFCFGGYAAITAATSGADVVAAVGFHPSLGGITPQSGIKAKVLVCHGLEDEFEKDNVAPFKSKMDNAGVSYVFKDYADARHGFTSPEADNNGKEFGIPVAYNAAADSASWSDMKSFLSSVFR